MSNPEITPDGLDAESPSGTHELVPWSAVRSVELARDGGSWVLALEAVEAHRAPAAGRSPGLQGLDHHGWVVPAPPAAWERRELLRAARRAWAQASPHRRTA